VRTVAAQEILSAALGVPSAVAATFCGYLCARGLAWGKDEFVLSHEKGTSGWSSVCDAWGERGCFFFHPSVVYKHPKLLLALCAFIDEGGGSAVCDSSPTAAAVPSSHSDGEAQPTPVRRTQTSSSQP